MSTSTDSRAERVTRRFIISGKVQGVYFRHSTRLEAQRLGLGGIARNLPDGSVEVVAHGAKDAIDALKDWLHVGPPMAKVAAVRELEGPLESALEPAPNGASAASSDFSVG